MMCARQACAVFNFVVWGVTGSLLCVAGLVGNTLAFCAFQRDKRSPTTTLLQCLAASDSVLLLSVIATDAVPYLCDYACACANPWRTWPYVRYVWLATPIAHMCSIWLVTLVAVNRYHAVCRPTRLGVIWTNRRAALYVCVALVVVIAFNAPRFFEYEIVEVPSSSRGGGTALRERRTRLGEAYSYKVVYKTMLVNVLLVVLPLLTLMVLTASVLRALAAARRRMRVKRKLRQAQEVTFVLGAVVVVAIVCQTPLAVFHFVRYVRRYACGDVIFYLDNISKLFVNVNSSANFVIYCLLSPRFRVLLCRTMACRRLPPGSPGVATCARVPTRAAADEAEEMKSVAAPLRSPAEE